MEKHSKNYSLAMNAAREYAVEAARNGSNTAKCMSLRDDIDGWVGSWIDGKLVIPQDVANVMRGIPAAYRRIGTIRYR